MIDNAEDLIKSSKRSFCSALKFLLALVDKLQILITSKCVLNHSDDLVLVYGLKPVQTYKLFNSLTPQIKILKLEGQKLCDYAYGNPSLVLMFSKILNNSEQSNNLLLILKKLSEITNDDKMKVF
jgi:hypothetical protein